MKVVVLFSGGKDSTYATWIAQHQGWEIEALVCVLPRSVESLMFHYPGVSWTSIQAKAMSIPYRTIQAGEGVETCTDELSSLLRGLERIRADLEIEGVVTGAVASDYQKSRIDQVCDAVGLKSFAPLWHKNPKTLVGDLKAAGFKIIISGVAASGLDESWLGRELTDDRWAKLESLSRTHGIHLTGEGGEYETFVLDGPNFRERVQIDKTHIQWDGQSGYLVIEQASLQHKLTN